METKRLGLVEVKSAAEGIVSAAFSTFNVIDHDQDVTLPGAFKDGQPVRISAFNHGSWGMGGALPVGKGVIRTTDAEAILEGQFFLNTAAGRDTFETVKELGALGEWSYSLHNVTAELGEWDGQPVRIIKAVDVHEVSPVLQGAGVNTRTLGVKSGLTFGDHLETVLADFEGVVIRAQGVRARRAEKGKDIGQESREFLERFRVQAKLLDELLAEPVESVAPELVKAFEAEVLRVYARGII